MRTCSPGTPQCPICEPAPSRAGQPRSSCPGPPTRVPANPIPGRAARQTAQATPVHRHAAHCTPVTPIRQRPHASSGASPCRPARPRGPSTIARTEIRGGTDQIRAPRNRDPRKAEGGPLVVLPGLPCAPADLERERRAGHRARYRLVDAQNAPFGARSMVMGAAHHNIPNGGYLGSGYGLGPITQSDLVCWPVRRPIDGRTPAILLVPGDQVAVPAWRHGRV